MQQSTLFKLSVILFLIPVLAGCVKASNPDDCFFSANANVTQVTGATTAAVNQEIDLTVSWTAQNGCGQLQNFTELGGGNTITVNVVAGYRGCVCTQNAPIINSIYKFKRAVAGTYTLQFLQAGNVTLSYTIVVS